MLILSVAPLVGAWIEIANRADAAMEKPSLPLWERGLKSTLGSRILKPAGRSPCGSVD